MKAKKPCHFIFLLKKERFLKKEQPYANPLPPPPAPTKKTKKKLGNIQFAPLHCHSFKRVKHIDGNRQIIYHLTDN